LKKTIITIAIIGLFSPIIVCAADSGLPVSDVHIRSLAASCAACHGTQGNAVPAAKTAALAGLDKQDISTKLLAFKSGERSATVMHRHAKGLTTDEITALAEYFSLQAPHVAAPLTPQRLRADHAN